MNFRKGKAVMHWTYGLGKIVRLEHRQLLGQKTLYYAVQLDLGFGRRDRQAVPPLRQ